MSSYILYLIVRGFAFGVGLLPHAPALWFGRRLGDMAYVLLGKQRAIAFQNIYFAYGSDLEPHEVARIVRGVFQTLAQTMIEVLRFPLLDSLRIRKIYRMEGEEHILRILKRGKGIISLTAHFGNWELCSFAGAWKGYPALVLAKRQKQTRVYEYLNHLRELSGCQVVGKGPDLKKIILHLRQNGVVGFANDQDSGGQGLWVNFFGRLTSFPKGAFEIASRTKSTLIPVFMVRERNRKHVQYVLPAMDLGDESLDRDKAWIQAQAQAFATIVEKMVRRFPDQWLWLHKRWKSSPKDRVWVLSDGKAGHANQSIAVAEWTRDVAREQWKRRFKIGDHAIFNKSGNKEEVRVSQVVYRNGRRRLLLALRSRAPFVLPLSGWRWLKWALTKESYESLKGACADFFISCGSSVAPVNRILGDLTGGKTLCIMKPTFPSPTRFDQVIIPQHDSVSPSRENVVVTRMTPTSMNAGDLALFQEAARKEFPSIHRKEHLGLCVGGSSGEYRHSPSRTGQLLDQLICLAEAHDWGLLVTTSRRTDPEVEKVVRERLTGHKQCELLVIAREENPPNTMRAIMALSQFLVVSEDSFSMISEASASGKRVVVYEVEHEGRPKQDKSLGILSEKGLIVKVPIERIGDTLSDGSESRLDESGLNKDRRLVEEAVQQLL
jgi:Kdo2-lipid IVA lauroyltransferase/acyltransferase